jgi:hypothetical protein
MIRWLSDLVCSRVGNHAATLNGEARVAYLRRMAFGYCLWIWQTRLLALISLACAAFTVFSALDWPRKIGFLLLFLTGFVLFVALSRCFVAAYRFARCETTKS